MGRTSTTSAAGKHGHLLQFWRDLRLGFTQDPNQLPCLFRVVRREVRVRGSFHPRTLRLNLVPSRLSHECHETYPSTTDPVDVVLAVVREIVVLQWAVSQTIQENN